MLDAHVTHDLVTELHEEIVQGVTLAGDQLAEHFATDHWPALGQHRLQGSQNLQVIPFGVDFQVAESAKPLWVLGLQQVVEIAPLPQ
ncbi:hypothetical protein Pan181_32610 [Aeoliella mucimassa]|uniref:Uncharacterized protein n=1 Tax=Aeoliella mucimassa TaxID=2527972 RepID=A0A518AQQ4_9BACT|nr:hypothetical protein Pan181_32610 [Aeoliella mucimassa]